MTRQLATRAAPAAKPPLAETAGSSLTRLLQILDLFTLERPTIRMEDVVQTLGIVQSTAYRYLRELCDVGLLAPQGKGSWCLGRRIVELERLLQLSDPLLLAGKDIVEELGGQFANRAFLLCALYRDGALCVYKAGPDEIRYRNAPMQIQRGRGSLLPLFSGAGSQAILAHLPPHQVKSLYLAHARQIAESGLGESWQEFRGALAQIRKTGHAETLGRVNEGMHSIAVPILWPQGRVAGSLLMLGAASKSEMAQALDLVPMLQERASAIGAALPQEEAAED